MFRLQRKIKFSLLLLVIVSGFVYLSYTGGHSAHPLWYQRIAQQAISPFAQTLARGAEAVRSLYQRYVALQGAKQETLNLQQELLRLKSESTRLQEENLELRRGQNEYRQNGINPSEAKLARVVGYDSSAIYRSITIDRGTEDGIHDDQIVVAGGGVIGRVLKAGNRLSQVLLVTDLHSSVDVLDARTRARGLLVGLRRQMGLQRERWLTQAEYVSASEEIKPGDLLLTSGLDGVFPKGLPIGVVSEVKKDSSGLFWQAEAEPYTELNKLEEVLVLDRPPGDG